jgi:hypothetical protein
MAEKFQDLRIVDNFYQTSAFFPMPTILVGTLCEDGMTNLGSYSLCFPYYVAGKEYYAMVLECRNNSNTAQNLLRYGKCSLNFIPAKRRFFKEAVRLGFPGDTPQEKMKNCAFTLQEGLMAAECPGEARPQVVAEAFQVFECTWMSELDDATGDSPGQMDGYPEPYHDFNGITSKFGAHFILRVDKILMKEKYRSAIVGGVSAGAFPPVPVDYGYRDSKSFWFTPMARPNREPIPKSKGISLDSVVYAAERIDPEVRFTPEACAKLVKVPRVFLNTVLSGCVKWARENNVTVIEPQHIDIINDKRAKEKKR